MRTLIAIPVFNELQTLPGVLDRVFEQIQLAATDPRFADMDLEVLVINDGSTDGTTGLIAQDNRISVLEHKANRGYGRSLIDAFNWAHEHLFDWIVTMDCDEQHEPAELPAFFEAISRDSHDIISGSRYLIPAPAGAAPPDRRGINMELTCEINDRLGPRFAEVGGELLTDSFCGFKAHRVSAMPALELTEEGYAFPMQLWVRAASHALRVREIPVSLIYNDPNRSFGADLDDPGRRRAHYFRVLHCEIKRHAHLLPAHASQAVCCR